MAKLLDRELSNVIRIADTFGINLDDFLSDNLSHRIVAINKMQRSQRIGVRSI